MRLELIKSFAVLGALCHFGEASRQLNISQPSLTKQIRRLEDLLGAPLFRRSRQGTELTAFGKRFLEEVQPVLRHADHVWEKGMKAARGEHGHLAIGFNFSAVEIMSRILFRFQKAAPGIDLSFDDAASEVQISRIAEGALDVGFVRLPFTADLACRRVATDRLAFVYPENLSRKISDFDSVAVRSMPFIGLQESIAPGFEKYIQRLFDLRGFQPAAMHRVNGPLTVLSLVSSGLGVALMHESAIRGLVNQVGGIVASPVLDAAASWEVGLVWRHSEQNPAVIRFLRSARAVVTSDTQGRIADWRLPPLRPGNRQ